METIHAEAADRGWTEEECLRRRPLRAAVAGANGVEQDDDEIDGLVSQEAGREDSAP